MKCELCGQKITGYVAPDGMGNYLCAECHEKQDKEEGLVLV